MFAMCQTGFSGGPNGKESACNSDLDSIPGEGNDNPLQYSCLENSMDRGARQAIAHDRKESDTTV